MISGGFDLQWLQAGSQFPNQRLKPGQGNESTKSLPLDQEGQRLVTSHLLWRKEFWQRDWGSEAKCLLRGKKSMCGWTYIGRLREGLCPQRSWHHLFGAVLWPIISLAWLWVHIWSTSGSPCAYTSFSQDGFQCKGFWEEHIMIWCSLCSLTSEKSFCTEVFV